MPRINDESQMTFHPKPFSRRYIEHDMEPGSKRIPYYPNREIPPEHLAYEGWSYGRDFMTNRPLGRYDRQYLARPEIEGSSRKGSHSGKGPKGWQRSDERIKEDASEALYHDPKIDASDIEVNVRNNVITLRGSVESREIKKAAEACVEFVPGVKDVQNDLHIRPVQ